MRSALFILFMLVSGLLFGQCLTGSLTVNGVGCGCLSNCDLSSVGGPDCNSGLSGNCNAGQVYMSVNIDLPGDCEVTAEARMSSRPGCSASGADSGDQLRVNGNSPHPWQTGAGNATLFDSNTQQGGSLTIEGSANRADEIITYEVFFVSGTCPFCILLPVELVSFDAVLEANTLGLFWDTASETNNKGFTIQASQDLLVWDNMAFIQGKGTTAEYSEYSHSVDLKSGLWYVRLAQEDFNGDVAYSPVVAVEIEAMDEMEIAAISGGALIRNTSGEAMKIEVSVYTTSGQVVKEINAELSAGASMVLELSKGLSLIQVAAGNQLSTKRIFRR